MKKFISILMCILLLSTANACPICGCGVGNFYMGLLPHFDNRFFGVRYEYMSYNTQLKESSDEFSNDYYNTAEFWGGISLGSKWQLLGFVPYHVNVLHSDEGIKKQNGIGDVSLLANYELWNSIKVNSDKTKMTIQELWIGGGLKLPTGKYKVDLNSAETELGDVNSQMGTGSVDFLLNAAYNININKFGVNSSVNYKINTNNTDDFHFGNRFTANTTAFYTLQKKKLSVVPNAGLLYEHAAVNHLSKTSLQETGGYLALGFTGLEINFGHFTVGGNVQIPLSQNFAHGQTNANSRGLVHLTVVM